jgi:energy-coupling factor transporter ATP-binding protein EcfA2
MFIVVFSVLIKKSSVTQMLIDHRVSKLYNKMKSTGSLINRKHAPWKLSSQIGKSEWLCLVSPHLGGKTKTVKTHKGLMNTGVQEVVLPGG